MNVNGRHYRTIWIDPDDRCVVKIIDQRFLPYRFVIADIRSVAEMVTAIKDMHVRGAGLIGAAAGYGMYLAVLEASQNADFDLQLEGFSRQLIEARPTAVNLAWAVQRQISALAAEEHLSTKLHTALTVATRIADEDADWCQRIGQHGVALIEKIAGQKSNQPVNILTHCNAGWLAFVDYGSATAPIYEAFERGIPVHVWVDETRPRNQGARLTAWELAEHGIPHTIITDNTGGHLMQHGMVDLVITGTDRTTRTGDVANKIGTYLKALAAKDNGIPFYVALPSSTFDWTIRDGIRDIPIEQRDPNEVRYMDGLAGNVETQILLTPESSPACNYAFDVTPSRLISGLITERGICSADEDAILQLFPEQR